MAKNFLQKLHQINTFVFDIDGVFTDGKVLIMPDGHQLRRMLVKDGFAVQQALKNGYRVAVISAGQEPSVKHRFDLLGVTDLFLGVSDKQDKLDEYLLTWDIPRESALYMGDDLPDFEAMQYAGVAACPANAAEEIKVISDYVSHKGGGEGCVRDVIEKVMRIQDKWMPFPAPNEEGELLA